MKKRTVKLMSLALSASMLCSAALTSPVSAEEAASEAAQETVQKGGKVRTIITTDGEIDDQCSLVRYMLYANMFELDGLISSSSIFHYATKEDEEFKGRDSNQKWIDAYAEVYENLCKHAEGFPEPDYLTSINLEGNIESPGEMATDTDGSLRIKECILDEREDPLYIQIWGGTNTLAAALRSIEEEYKDTDQWEEIYQKVCSKVKVWADLDQDNTFNDYILPNWPNIEVVMSYDQFWSFGYFWRDMVPEAYHPYFEADFMKNYIANDKNPLAEIYYNNLTHGGEGEVSGFMSEGDTPNFFYILDNGLRSAEDPSYGGWAGRFDRVAVGMNEGNMLGSLWSEAYDDGDRYKALYRWIDDFQNDFAARMEWCTESYEDANHEPEVEVEEGIDIFAERGETVTLTAKTNDPDGDQVNVTFWQYGDADTYAGEVELVPGEGDQVTFTVPEDAKLGDTIHIIVEAQDNGELPITRYQRVIVTVPQPETQQ